MSDDISENVENGEKITTIFISWNSLTLSVGRNKLSLKNK